MKTKCRENAGFSINLLVGVENDIGLCIKTLLVLASLESLLIDGDKSITELDSVYWDSFPPRPRKECDFTTDKKVISLLGQKGKVAFSAGGLKLLINNQNELQNLAWKALP